MSDNQRLYEALQENYRTLKKNRKIPVKKKREPPEYDPYKPKRFVDDLLDTFSRME